MNPLRLRVFSELSKVRDKKRQRTLEDLLEQRTRDDIEHQKESRGLDRVLKDARIRDEGYVPTDESEPVVTGQSLDEMVRMGTGSIGMGGARDVYDPDRYGEPVGGYKYDNLSLPAREKKARVARAERLASADDADGASYTERKDQQMRSRIAELVQGGMSPEKANRQARLEAGQSVSSLEDRLNSNAEPAHVRNARRGAQHNANLYNTTQSEIARLKRELGNYPDEQDPRIKEIRSRLKVLGAKADSIGGVRDSLSTVFTQAISGAPTSQPPASASGNVPSRSALTSAMDSALASARKEYEAALRAGADSAQARQLYESVVRAIRAKHSRANP